TKSRKKHWITIEKMVSLVLDLGNRLFSFKHTNNLKIFLLKQIAKKFGIVFVQNLLENESVLSNAIWINEWKESDPEAKRFVRKKLMITHDPFCMYDTDGYQLLQEGIKASFD